MTSQEPNEPKSADIKITDQVTEPLSQSQSIKASLRIGNVYRDTHYKIGGSN